jgi:quinohemoprotein amine dehydrogenase
MQRISWARSRPESWQSELKQMSLVNGVSLTPSEARSMVKYLSMDHGLAPDEAKPLRYDLERRIPEETNIPNDDIHNACAKCHTLACSCANPGL